MEINQEKIKETFKRFVDKFQEKFVDCLKDFEEAWPEVVQASNEFKQGVTEDCKKEWSDFIKGITNVFSYDNVRIVRIQDKDLDLNKLSKVIRENIVESSNEVYALKKAKDDQICIYLAYGRNGEMLDKESNCYVVLVTKSLKEDVLNLFNESELVIIK